MSEHRAREDIREVTNRMRGIFQGRNKQRQRDLLHKLGLEAIDMVVERTRNGFGVRKTGGNRRTLKPLSDRYIEFRSKNRGRLDRRTSPSKSNLTFTGQLLDSVRILKSTDGRFEIGPSGRRNDRKRNADVGRWVTEQGRPFMNLGRAEITSLQRYLREEIELRIMRSNLGSRRG